MSSLSDSTDYLARASVGGGTTTTGKKCPFCKNRGRVELQSRIIQSWKPGFRTVVRRRRVRLARGTFRNVSVRDEVPVVHLVVRRGYACEYCSRKWNTFSRKTIRGVS
jgi:hypothetical protein